MSRQPRKPKTGPYQKVNGYTQSPAKQQIISASIFLGVLILHSIFIVPPIVGLIRHPILLFFLGLNYLLILLIIYDYLVLTIKDPVDRLVNGQVSQNSLKPEQMKKCIICDTNVFKGSYHCMRCNRCTEDFDHHCKYLNNCVGSKNYENFFRILITLTIYFLNVAGQSLYIFIDSFLYDQLEDYMISRWPVLVVGIVVLFLIFGVDSLLVFHIYLSVCRKMTTLQYIFRQTSSNTSGSATATSLNSESDNREAVDVAPNIG